jgi:hypothetical protein
MIILITFGLFRCVANPMFRVLFALSITISRISFTYPSKASNVIMERSLIIMIFIRFYNHLELFFVCPVHTCLPKMARLSMLSALSMILCILCYFNPISNQATMSMPSKLPHISTTDDLAVPFNISLHMSLFSSRNQTTSIFESSTACASQICPPRCLTSLRHGHPGAFSSDIPASTRGTNAWTSKQIKS